MGLFSRVILPACGNMCVCCPALKPSSRRPVKRYKKLLAQIFPKTLDGPPNERKIMKLCEYAAKNPFRIPKIAKFLEQRSYKELRCEHINYIKIITEVYSKLLFICKDQMAYFAISLLNVILELLDCKQQDTIRTLGCQTLTRFIYSQADNTYARNIESLVHKVCMLAREDGVDHKIRLRAAGLQCLSAMVWFMTEYSHIFADFDEIIHAALDNYGIDQHIEDDDERRESHHNWVDEVVRSEARGGETIRNDYSPSNMTFRPQPEIKDSSMLTREESETPEVWAKICIQKLAELAKESSTMRRVLDPMFIYFDIGRHWSPLHGLALPVLSDMSYLVKSSGNEQLILAAIIRHLDHKNVAHDPQIKSDIIQIATSLIRQLRPRAVFAEIGVASDLCRHLRKSLQATVESVGLQESNWNVSLQNSIEECLLEIAKGICDTRPLFDMMAITMEKLPAIAVVARATIGSLLILAHIIALASINSNSQLVFPEALLLELVKTMMHPDVETRTGAHQIFSVILARNQDYPKHESEYLYEPRKWQSKTASAFASATALLEKLRREKEGLNAEKHGNDAHDTMKEKDMGEELKHGWVRKSSPNFHKFCSVTDRTAASTSFAETDTIIIILAEDQIALLLTAFWRQANQPDNLPSDFEAIAHSFSLTLLSSRLKNSNHSHVIRFIQLCLSLRNVSLDPNGILPPSCRRSLFLLATMMLAFVGKVYHIPELADSLKLVISSDVDPYLRIGNDLQIYVRSQSDLKEYGSDSDQQAASSSLADLRKTLGESDHYLLGIIVQGLSPLTDFVKDDLAKQLSETFIPEDGPLFGPNTVLDWASIQALALSEESFSFDEECSRSSSRDEVVSESPATDFPRFVSRMPTPSSLPHVISVGQLLESALQVAGQVACTSVSTSPLPYGTMASQCEALGMGARKKLSSWLSGGHDSISEKPLPTFHMGRQSAISKTYGSEQEDSVPSAPWLALRLPPASPFDNFLKAAGC